MNTYIRQVDIILQNHTPELLTLESAVAIQGQWGNPSPVIGSVVVGQGAGRWQSGSTDVGIGTEGFLRFGSTRGYAELHWLLPHDASEYQFQVVCPEGLLKHHAIKGPGPDKVVFSVILTPE